MPTISMFYGILILMYFYDNEIGVRVTIQSNNSGGGVYKFR